MSQPQPPYRPGFQQWQATPPAPLAPTGPAWTPSPPPQWQPPPQRHSRTWLWVTLLVAVVAGIIGLVVALTGGGTSASKPFVQPAVPAPATSSAQPAPISRSELMAEYARIAPMDRSATPETIDELATKGCGLLYSGTSSDRLISASTDIYGAQATQVVRLLVSYKCPQFLKDFK